MNRGALSAVYPEHHWHPWLFKTTDLNQLWATTAITTSGGTMGFSSAKAAIDQRRRNYLHWLEAEFGINEPNEWYRIKAIDVRNKPGGNISILYDLYYHYISILTIYL